MGTSNRVLDRKSDYRLIISILEYSEKKIKLEIQRFLFKFLVQNGFTFKFIELLRWQNKCEGLSSVTSTV